MLIPAPVSEISSDRMESKYRISFQAAPEAVQSLCRFLVTDPAPSLRPPIHQLVFRLWYYKPLAGYRHPATVKLFRMLLSLWIFKSRFLTSWKDCAMIVDYGLLATLQGFFSCGGSWCVHIGVTHMTSGNALVLGFASWRTALPQLLQCLRGVLHLAKELESSSCMMLLGPATARCQATLHMFM